MQSSDEKYREKSNRNTQRERRTEREQKSVGHVYHKSYQQEEAVARPGRIEKPQGLQGVVLKNSGAAGEDKLSKQRELASKYSNRLKKLLGKSDLTARQRVDRLVALNSALNKQEIKEAQDFLKETKAPEGIGEGEWHWLTDEVMTALRDDGSDPQALIRIQKNPKQHRDHYTGLRRFNLK